jgi:transposase
LGWSTTAIAQHLDLDRGTVHQWRSCTEFPERLPRPARRTLLQPYEPYVAQRWQEGCRNARQIWQELRAHGYPGGYTQVTAYVRTLRTAPGGRSRRAAAPRLPRGRSLRQLKGLLLRPLDDLAAEECAVLAELSRRSAAVGIAYGLAVDFTHLVRARQPQHLRSWLALAETSGIAELMSFARGIQRDFAAVYAGLEGPVSNGPVEGHVNRLKALKRRSYGRAKFDLLRLHVLYAH